MLGVGDLAFDSAAAVVVDGRLVSAVAEERLSRVKHGGGFPARAIAEALRAADLRPQDVRRIALVGRRDWTGRVLASALSPGGGDLRVLDRAADRALAGAYEGYLALSDATALGRADHHLADALTRALLRRAGLRAPIVRVDHHLCHAAASFHSSGFAGALALVADARGDGDRALSLFQCDHRGIHLLASTPVEHSLGYLYGGLTELAGFHHNSEEGKLNALAAHGGPSPVSARLDAACAVQGLGVRIDRPGRHRGRLTVRDLARWLGPGHAPEDLAWAAQRTVERLVTGLLTRAMARTGHDRVVLGGGLFLNVGVNLAVAELPGLRGLHLFPAAGDNGTAVGAALLQAPGLPGQVLPGQALPHAFLGAPLDPGEVRAAVGARPHRRCEDIADEAAARICQGQVIAWVQGRAEHGPRALGGRSLVALAQDPDSPARLRALVKDRPDFQPFCPSITRQALPGLVEVPSTIDPRFMIVTGRATARLRQACPAAVHIDGTVRVQAVDAEVAPRWHRLIERVGARTGLPVVLNTSLNRSGEPICQHAAHAVDLFDHTGVDALAIDDLLLERA